MAGRNALGVGTTEERLQRLEMLANFREYIAPISIVGGRDVGATPPLHPLLSALGHSDTTTQTVSRGSLIYGNSTPAWDELVSPATTGVLGHDATDAAWVTTSTNGAVFRRNNAGALGFGAVDLDTANTVVGTLSVTNGGTNANLSATGGTSQVLQQTSAGANITVGQLAASNLSNGTTGSGAVVLATGPTLSAPLLGTPASGTLTNCTGFPVANLAGAGSGVLTWLATPSSANLLAAVTDETGSASGTPLLVFNQSPTIVTPTIASFTNATHTHQNAAGGGQLDHGAALTGLGDDDHSIYTLLAGRSGTNNNTTLSTSADGTLTGSGTTGFDLRLNSDSHTLGGTTVSRGYLHALQPLRVVPDGYTIDNDTLGFPTPLTDAENRNLALIAIGDSTITLSGNYPSFRVLTCNGTVACTESDGNGLSMGLLFNHAFTYTNVDTKNLGPVQTLVDQPTFSVNATTSARTQTFHAGYRSAITLTRSAGSNGVTLTSLYGAWLAHTVNTGCTVTNMYGTHMASIGGSGTVTNRWGLYMEDPVGATVTNDYVAGYNANIGTHNCLTGKAGTHNVSFTAGDSPVGSALVIKGWERKDVNGTVMYTPLFGV